MAQSSSHLETDTVKVIFGSGDNFTSKLISKTPFKQGDIISSFRETSWKTGRKTYTTVQLGSGDDDHWELGGGDGSGNRDHKKPEKSPFTYLNHSCVRPTVWLDVENWCFRALMDIEPNDELTFFYPSTEWEMAQPFDCWCDSEKSPKTIQSYQCLRRVSGASRLSVQQIEIFKPILSSHIKNLLKVS